jgi:hypothetical protein
MLAPQTTKEASMSDRLLIGTRKGLFEFGRTRKSGWTIAKTAFLGDPVSMVLPDARDGIDYAALALGHFGVKLHRSADRGRTWEECAAPAFAPTADAREDAPSVTLIWSLETGGAADPSTLWAGTIPGGLFKSTDGGASWSLVQSLWDVPERAEWFGGGYDKPGVHSICVDPRDPRHLIVAVSCGGVWISEDGGASWRVGGPGMYAEYMPPERREVPQIQDPHRMVQCPARPDTLWVQHHNGVFRSPDGARSWEEVTAIRPSKFGFAVAVHPDDCETAWFVPGIKDERRIPVDGKLVVARTRDGGRSCEVLDRGLPQADAYDLVYRHGLAVDETGARLAMGSTTGHLWISEDSGDSWSFVAGHLPPIASVRFAS